MKIIIGIGHRARSGKDTFASAITKHREGTEIISFAKPLKEEVTQAAISAGGMENLFREDYYFVRADGVFVTLPNWVQPELNMDMSDPYCPLGKNRSLLQFWGTEFRRSVDDAYWIKKHREAVDKSSASVILVPDMRFSNEMAYCQENGYAIRVDRPGLPPLNGASGVHPSELALANVPNHQFDFILDNDGTLKEFQEKSISLFDYIMEYKK